ncbi:hypothetical protein SAMN05216259_103212 [Actinacidiphila guanduensis]|uniref:Uncharacterized protein n=1 Tax=Actinacidiphila guanduensis TaxID=310781 RepID=A0A1G9ZKT3_9ACTN|nr:hypothetical protein SAMN05216259_103212 [Actinacidiphila guanduensis]
MPWGRWGARQPGPPLLPAVRHRRCGGRPRGTPPCGRIPARSGAFGPGAPGAGSPKPLSDHIQRPGPRQPAAFGPAAAGQKAANTGERSGFATGKSASSSEVRRMAATRERGSPRRAGCGGGRGPSGGGRGGRVRSRRRRTARHRTGAYRRAGERELVTARLTRTAPRGGGFPANGRGAGFGRGVDASRGTLRQGAGGVRGRRAAGEAGSADSVRGYGRCPGHGQNSPVAKEGFGRFGRLLGTTVLRAGREAV